MTILTANGEHGANAPTLALTQRTSGTGRPEVHIIARADGDDSTKAVAAWYDRDALLHALSTPGANARLAKEGA